MKQIPGSYRLAVQGEAARFNTRELQQFRHHLGEGVHFDLDLLDEPARRRRVIQCAVLQGFGEGLQGGKRCTQLVREVADEIAPYCLQAADVGKILCQQQAAARVPVRDDDKLQILMAGWHFDRFALQLAGLLTAAPGLDQQVVADNFGNAALHGI